MKAVAALLVAVALLPAACLDSSPTPTRLAASQVLHLVAFGDVQTLDPAKVHQPSVELGLVRNVFGGLYRFDRDLKEVPDLATGPPEVSADGLMYTFHLRSDAVFWNGDPVGAGDVLYSWNRVAALTKYASSFIFEKVAGFPSVAAGRSQILSGLTAADDHTVVAHLIEPAGWWFTELGLWAAAVVDQRVIRLNGEDGSWQSAAGLVGTGPFKMAARSPNSLDFERVEHWWAGASGSLKRVHVDVIADETVQLSGYRAGRYDIVGYLPPSTALSLRDDTIRTYQNSDDLKTRPWLRTSFITYPATGRLTPAAADAPARKALSLALNRQKLANDVCAGSKTCVPATGGLIPKGLRGYLDPAGDANANFDRTRAKSLLSGWDPDGSRLGGTLRVGVLDSHRALASAMVEQWQNSLGLHAPLQVAPDGRTLGLNASKSQYDVIIAGNLADYDSPENWFSNVSCGRGDPRFAQLVQAAGAKVSDLALPTYKQANQLLADEAYCPALVYLQGVFLVHSWVHGAGANSLYEYEWREISILEHH